METRRSARCEHQPTWVGRVAVAACADCGQVDWFSDAGPLDPAEGMAYLFGTYDLVDHLDALAAPAPSVLVYAPPSARKRRNLDVMPKHVWLKVGVNLWLSHDGQRLLLATNQQLLIDNLTRGA
ncbi:MAG TPA: hypothetical protein VI980_11510 [Acidimicrobiia bacterium]|nr:hypothetical protein [Acidimicrobiia bacterium]